MRGTLTLELTDGAGHLLAARRTRNAVMRSGAQLVAGLFARQGTGITHMGVGVSDEPESGAYDTAALTVGEGDEALQGNTEVAIAPEAFAITIDEAKRLVRVRVRATLPAEAAVGTIREAGLVSREGENAVLYNRVTFASVHKGDDHELTLFWEMHFPYGDLPW